MKISTEVKNLASLVTFRQLYDDGKKDLYYVVSKFAEDVIASSRLYSFDITEMAERIQCNYGFKIPDYVIQTSLKKLLCVKKEKNVYTVDPRKLSKEVIGERYKGVFDANNTLVNALEAFVKEKKEDLSYKDKELLIREFCAFLLDESNGNGFSDVISAFIIENQSNEELMKQIKQIKEGAVLFAGLNHNSNISEKGAWRAQITIYIEIEILFHLAGYNGEVFKRHAEDLFSLISEMNSRGKNRPIKLRYFSEVKEEIEKFFTKAENIVIGNDIVDINNYAMNTIIKGCQSPSDIIEKKTYFFKMLTLKGIMQAEEYDYYCEENHKYNLESPECVEKYKLTEEKFRYIRHINYTNILRQGRMVNDLKLCQHIVLSEVGKMLRISNDVVGKGVPLVINMGGLTNRLWFDLNKGFGAKEFPSNFDVLLKSQIVLSSVLSQSVSEKYEQAYDKYKRKEINAEQMADVIITLREEIKKPEEIVSDDVDEVLEFITEKELNIYRSEKEILDSTVKEKEKEIENYKRLLSKQEEKIIENANKKDVLIEERDTMLRFAMQEKKIRYDDLISLKQHADYIIDKKVNRFKWALKLGVIGYYIAIAVVYFSLDFEKQDFYLGVLTVIPPIVSCIISIATNKKINLVDGIEYFVSIKRKRVEKKEYDFFNIDLGKIEILKMELEQFEQSLTIT